jgi:hypothetical protein
MPKVSVQSEKEVLWSNFETLRGIKGNLQKAIVLIEQLEEHGIDDSAITTLAEALMIDLKVMRMEFPQTGEAMLNAWKKYTGE